jgi:hypothetical protein
MLTRFEAVLLPQTLDQCRSIADGLQSALGDVLPPVRFEAMRQTLKNYEQLPEQEQADFRAAMGWRRDMFLDDKWLHAEVTGAPDNRPAFAKWAIGQLANLRKRISRPDGMSNSGAAQVSLADAAPTLERADDVMNGDLSSWARRGTWVSQGAVDWFVPKDKISPEIVHQALRLNTFVPLVTAFVLKGDRRYLDHAYRMMADLQWQIPGTVMQRLVIRTHWGIDALDVAIRSYHLMEIMANGSTDNGFNPDQAMFLWKLAFWCGARGLEMWHRYNHNILMFESANLAAMGFYFPAFKDSAAWREEAQKRLKGAMYGCVLSDGCNFEAAPRYHTIYLREPYMVMKAIEDTGLPALPGLAEAVRKQGLKLADYWARILSPSGTVPSLGDSSPMFVRTGLMTAAAFYGAEFALSTDPEKPAGWPKQSSFYLPANRMAVMRSGWDKDALWLCYALRGWHHGHDHRDCTHFELQAGDRQLLIDSGSIDYHANRLRGQETRAHNTLVVDGLIQLDGGAHDIRWYSNEDFDWCEALNLGFPGILHRRAVCFLKPGCFVVVDRVNFHGPATKRQFELYYHFAHDMNLSFSERSVQSNDAGKWNVKVDLLADDGWTLSRTEGFWASGFLQETPAPVAILTGERDKGFTLVTLIQPIRPGETAKVSATLAEVRCTNAAEGSVLPGSSGAGVSVDTGSSQATILWTDPGIGEKRCGEPNTDGDLLITVAGRTYARNASYAGAGFTSLHDQSAL